MPAGIYETLLNNFKLLVEKFTYNKTDIDSKLSGKADNTVASGSSNGLMSSADKTKLDTIEEGANKTIVDSSLSGESENPVQNKIIKTALDGKAEISHNHDDLYYTETEVDEKLETIQGALDSLVGFEAKIVEELPPTGEDGIMYLVLSEGGGADKDIYDEYIYVNGNFEKIGNTAVEVDLSSYATKEYVGTQLSGYVTTSKLASDLATKANVTHNHAVTDITDLQTKLDEKLTITSLPTELNDILEQMLQE